MLTLWNYGSDRLSTVFAKLGLSLGQKCFFIKIAGILKSSCGEVYVPSVASSVVSYTRVKKLSDLYTFYISYELHALNNFIGKSMQKICTSM